MRELIINDFYLLLTQFLIGFAYLIYLYKRQKFSRLSRVVAGGFLIFFAAVSISTVGLVIDSLDLFNSALKTTGERKLDFPEYLLNLYLILKLMIPFSFAAVGSGLIANALVNRDLD